MQERGTWREQLLEHGRKLGRRTFEHKSGVGIEFEDGHDVFWILPGEVFATVEVPKSGPESVEYIVAVYDAINRLRERALHVIRHFLASKNIRVDRDHGSQWGLQMEGGASTSLVVGASLTKIARDTDDIYQVVSACIKYSWVGKVPSRRRIDRYLNISGAPADERPHLSEVEQKTTPVTTLKTALAWLGVCAAIDRAAEATSASQLANAVKPAGRIGQMLLHLADRLPQIEAHTKMGKKNRGQISLTFTDRQGTFTLLAKSRETARRISELGPIAVGDQLADEFLLLDSARTRFFRAVYQAASARKWRRQSRRSGFLSGGDGRVMRLGRTHREVTFDPDIAITGALRSASVEAALSTVFSSTPEFLEDCLYAAAHPLPDEQVQLADGNLAPLDVPSPPDLLALSPGLIDEMYRFANRSIAEFLADERTLWKYHDSHVYDKKQDAWAGITDWVRLAEQSINREWPHPTAIPILIDAGDPRGEALARAYIEKAQPHHEVSDDEVQLVWGYRHDYPDVARKWFSPQTGDDVPFCKVRARLGDPIAAHAKAVESNSADVEDSPDGALHLPADQQEKLHAELVEWAQNDYQWAGPRREKLNLALKMCWPDVADALERNLYLLSGLLTYTRRTDQFDEPGMLLAADFMLIWSRLSPSIFLARLIATAHKSDLVGLAEKASAASALRRPEFAKNVASANQVYRIWAKQLDPALAISWKRCREWTDNPSDF